MMRILEVQWSDTVKARIVDRKQTNPYREQTAGMRSVRAQEATYRMLANQR
jgi:uncharacterized protein YjhX (UPF0386 family)